MFIFERFVVINGGVDAHDFAIDATCFIVVGKEAEAEIIRGILVNTYMSFGANHCCLKGIADAAPLIAVEGCEFIIFGKDPCECGIAQDGSFVELRKVNIGLG